MEKITRGVLENGVIENRKLKGENGSYTMLCLCFSSLLSFGIGLTLD